MSRGEISLAFADEEDEAPKPRKVNLAAPTSSSRSDRRLEDWIAGNLDIESERPASNLWSQLVGNLPSARRKGGANGSDRGYKSKGCWGRFAVVYRRGAAVVRLTNSNLVQRAEINELADDLHDLIAAGNNRVVLNFANVERLGSWIVAAAVEAHRRCEAVEGGRLKVCGLSPQLAEVFEIINVGRRIVVCPDENAAVDGPWPGSRPKALPVDILEALLDEPAPPPVRGGSPAAGPDRAGVAPREVDEAPADGDGLMGRVWLEVDYAGAKGKMLPVAKTAFRIGREKGSHLRIGVSSVSKAHATIEIRGERAFVRDLKSTNGTILNGRTLRDEEAELSMKDELEIGPARCRVWVDVSRSELEQIGVLEPSWSPEEARVEEPADVPAEAPSTADLDAYNPEDEGPGGRIKCEVVQDVLVVTPVMADLDGEEANEALRLRLLDLMKQPLPRRVIVDMEFAGRISRQTIGVLLAHHLRLDRTGGSLRLCQAHPRIMAMLDQVRLTMLVDCFPTLDEAVLSPWTAGELQNSAR